MSDCGGDYLCTNGDGHIQAQETRVNLVVIEATDTGVGSKVSIDGVPIQGSLTNLRLDIGVNEPTKLHLTVIPRRVEMQGQAETVEREVPLVETTAIGSEYRTYDVAKASA